MLRHAGSDDFSVQRVERSKQRGSAAELEAAQQVGLQAMLFPDAPDRSLANARGLGQAARAPVGSVSRLFPSSHAYDLLYSFGGDLWLAARTRRIFLDARQPQPIKSTAPTRYGLALHAQLGADLEI